MHRLICNVQNYGWGRRGHESKVALFKKAADFDFKINDSETYAELWMGTHSNCPSKIEIKPNEFILLSDYIKQDPSKTIGEKIMQYFYVSDEESTLKPGDLPFLFKVLSINQALSIQAHPNKTLARQLNKFDPKNYPDSNHKPEMLIAISEQFDAMCGFRPINEIVNNFNNYPELVNLCSKENCDQFINSTEKNSIETEMLLKKCFSSMMIMTESLVAEQFNQLKQRILSQTNQSNLDKLFLNLSEQYPNDVGCFSIFLLNCLKLNKGEAIYLSANVPHAYLYGDGVECMACSDNVVRAGLTPKFKDVQVLCDMLDYRMKSSEENKLKPLIINEYLTEFKPSVDEFSVQVIRINNKESLNDKYFIPSIASGSILIITESSLNGIEFETSDGKTNEIKAGLVYYLDPFTDLYIKVDQKLIKNDFENVLLAFRAYCDIKN